MFEGLVKVFSTKFSFTRNQSPNQTAKANNGKAGSSIGDQSSVQIADTINNNYSSQNQKAITQHNDLRNLKKIFTNDVAKRIAAQVKDPKRIQKNCNDIKSFIQSKCEAIQLSANDPKRKNLIESYEQAIILLESFIQDEISESQLIEEWIKIGDNF